MDVGLKMELDVKGTGPALVLVGGGLTGAASWEPFQARLASARRVARAQPLSVQYGLENAKLPRDYSVEMESAALGAALDAFEPRGPMDLVAWSYGGAITLDYALDHPERVRTLTLIEPPALWVLDETGTSDETTRREVADLRALYAHMVDDVTEDQLASFVRMAGFCPDGKSPQELPPWPSWVQHRRSLRAGDAPFVHNDTVARLRAFARPVLLVKGTGSSHFLHRIQDGLASALPRAERLELPGGHAPHLAATEAFLAKLASFQGGAQTDPPAVVDVQ